MRSLQTPEAAATTLMGKTLPSLTSHLPPKETESLWAENQGLADKFKVESCFC
jgi:hypothetical protein